MERGWKCNRAATREQQIMAEEKLTCDTGQFVDERLKSYKDAHDIIDTETEREKHHGDQQ